MPLKPFMIIMLGRGQIGYIKPSTVVRILGKYMVRGTAHLKLDPEGEYTLRVLLKDGIVLMDGKSVVEGTVFEQLPPPESPVLLYIAEFLGKDPTTPS